MVDLTPWIGLLLGLTLSIVGCKELYACLPFWRQQRQLQRKGITVQGRVIDHRKEYNARGQPVYYITCAYSIEGQRYTCDHPVWRDFYDRESYVSVRCLPGVDTATVQGDDFLRVEKAQLTILGGVFCVLGVGILSFVLAYVLPLLARYI